MNRPILLVEDNDDDVFFMQQVKRRAGIPNPLHIVDHGEKAIAYLKGENGYRDREKFPIPGLILMDLKLPYVPGLEVLRWIRQEFATQTLIVVILTASRAAEDIDAAYRLGANSYLIKPGNIDALFDLVKSVGDYWLRYNAPPLITGE